MHKSLTILVAVALACAREAAQAPVAVAADAAMRHYDIRFEQLPPPFATPSAGNPPIVTPRPAGAMLHLPPGFSINEYASGLDDPRAMLLLTNGDVLLAEPGAGHVLLLRDANHDGIAEVRYTLISGLIPGAVILLLMPFVPVTYKAGRGGREGFPKSRRRQLPKKKKKKGR